MVKTPGFLCRGHGFSLLLKSQEPTCGTVKTKESHILKCWRLGLNIRILCVLVAQSSWTLCDLMEYIACQAPLSMEFCRQEYWCRLPFLDPGDLPNPRIKPGSPALQADSLPSQPKNWGGGVRIQPIIGSKTFCQVSVVKGKGLSQSKEASLPRFGGGRTSSQWI